MEPSPNNGSPVIIFPKAGKVRGSLLDAQLAVRQGTSDKKTKQNCLVTGHFFSTPLKMHKTESAAQHRIAIQMRESENRFPFIIVLTTVAAAVVNKSN